MVRLLLLALAKALLLPFAEGAADGEAFVAASPSDEAPKPPPEAIPEVGGAPRAPSADDALGFGAPGPSVALEEAGACSASPSEPSPLRLAGFARSELGAFVDGQVARPVRLARGTLEGALDYERGSVRMRAGLHAEGDAATYFLRDHLAASERRSYGPWVLPWELFAELRRAGVTLTVGRQIAAYGHAQSFPLLDLANPRDTRVPLLGVPAERRVPLAMTRLAYDRGAHRLELLLVHEADYRFRPPPLGLYSVLPALLAHGDGLQAAGLVAQLDAGDARYRQLGQGITAAAAQGLVRYRYDAAGATLGLLGGLVTQADGVFRLRDLSTAPDGLTRFTMHHPRYGVLGASLEAARGPFVTYGELLVELARPINVGDLDAPVPRIGVSRQNWERITLGARYEGLERQTFALELTAGVEGWKARAQADPALLPVAPTQLGASYRVTFWRDRLAFDALASVLGPRLRGGAVARATLSWSVRDALRLQLAYVGFYPGSQLSVISGFRQRDRVDLALRWDFEAS